MEMFSTQRVVVCEILPTLYNCSKIAQILSVDLVNNMTLLEAKTYKNQYIRNLVHFFNLILDLRIT